MRMSRIEMAVMATNIVVTVIALTFLVWTILR